ncbi:hypothetical protein [Rhizobium sp. CC-YZS058]|uniref:hypothetical protein n=1 Tax=Rhizobium sp. CC-YZS058 TaxID=3042153 RepID=UPI002B05EB98|nr:hypothetical protein [Rhizobium sp. CC-YZS058]MEA3535318.1 hypothetical protein [Rhizobium sp. CC-YZS058]
MTNTTAKSLRQAEALFTKPAPPSTARERAFEELDSIALARDEKTVRLREARLAKEVRDAATPQAKPPARRTRKP